MRRWVCVVLLTAGNAACDTKTPRRAHVQGTANVNTLVAASGAASHSTRAATSATAAAPAPVARVEGTAPIDGATLLAQVKQRKLRGALINVWASWCGSCRREIPMLLGLREAFAAQGLDVLFVSADEREKWPDAVAFARTAGLPLPAQVVGGPIATFKREMTLEWRGAIPASFLFDGSGQLRHRWEGPVYEHEVAPVLQAFLAGQRIDGATLPPLSAGHTTP